jgi:hypothetical protein
MYMSVSREEEQEEEDISAAPTNPFLPPNTHTLSSSPLH